VSTPLGSKLGGKYNELSARSKVLDAKMELKGWAQIVSFKNKKNLTPVD
jgi:hypothetical protein